MSAIERRRDKAIAMEARLTSSRTSLSDFASGHEYFGLHRRRKKWIFREWAPNASAIHLIGDFSGWKKQDRFALNRINESGVWEIELPLETLTHGCLYRLHMSWPGGEGDRIPAYARRVVQDNNTKIFNAQVWAPEKPYRWKHKRRQPREKALLIYESHVGMAQEKEDIGTYIEFQKSVLPRVVDAGYNAIQLMAIMEHPYYASFGYQVSSFFAASSRFGTPEELKALIDTAHGAGLSVIMDLIHSHAVSNEIEGISRFDGTHYQYFHEGQRGSHPAWNSRCFNYSKPEVLHFLLSNCRFWLDEYQLDGFRFDGITSMLYHHHGLGPAFDSYDRYFDDSVDEESIVYLTLANKLIHSVNPSAVTIAEDVSGMPGLAAPAKDGGCGFDYRLAMGVPDMWFKLVNDVSDENWNMDYMWHELVNRRGDEKTISYAECHDQALVGGKTLIFEMIDADMYFSMRKSDNSLLIDRGLSLHKMARLATVSAAGHGYLNFMGNEFGHPEWIDFPREGNNWSYHHARRQWHLRYDQDLKYHFLADFDKEMIALIKKHAVIEKSYARSLVIDTNEKILVFERGGLFFFFNFHPDRSVADYRVEILPGEYRLELDTDELRFGGHGRLEPKQTYFTIPIEENSTLKNYLQIYLPCRSALVIAPRR